MKIIKRFVRSKKMIGIIGTILSVFLFFFIIPIYHGNTIYKTLIHIKKYKEAIQAENYDKMKISYGKVKSRMTGTEKFDTPDGKSVDDGSLVSDMLGKDVSAYDNYVRTYDTITYTLELGIERNEKTTTADDIFKGGIIKVKASIPTKDEGVYLLAFQEDSWMKKTTSNTYKTELTAYYEIPKEKSPVGGNQELSFTIIVGGYKDIITEDYTPKFEVWMEGNKNDDPTSSNESVIVSDENPINITAKGKASLRLYEGGINHKAVVDGVKGNYYNFGVTIRSGTDSSNYKGTVIPREPIESKIKIEYYYKNIDENSGWIKIDENDPKATDLINGTKLIAYGRPCEETSGFWPTPNSNKGYDQNSCATGSSTVCTGGGTLSQCYKFNYDSGNFTASQEGNIITFKNTNNSFYGFYYSTKIIVDGFELFIPYYDDGGANYEYQIKLVDNELSFKDNLGESYVIDPNASLTTKIINNLGGNFSYYFNPTGSEGNQYNIDLNTIGGLGTKASYNVYSYAKDGNYEGGKDTLITVDTSAVSLTPYSNSNTIYASYSNNGVFDTPSKDTVVIQYGIYKDNPSQGLTTDELVNKSVYEDFDWYESLEEAKTKGEPCAIYILEPENKGNKVFLNTIISIISKEDSSAMSHVGMLRQKVRYYEDEEKTIIHKIGYDVDYIKTVIEDDTATSSGTPRDLGHTYLIFDYNLKTETAFTQMNGSSQKINYNVEEEYIDVRVQPRTVYSGTINDSVKSSFKLTTQIPTDLTYVENSATIEPDEVVKNNDGTSTLTWYFNNWQVNEAMPEITFKVSISKYTDNNAQKRFTTNLYDLNHTIIPVGNSSKTAGIINLAGSSIQKDIETNIIEANNSVKINDAIYNISQSLLLDVKTFEILPKNNDENGSKFSGNYTYTINQIDDGQKLYYSTTNPDSIEYEIDDLGNKTIQSIDLLNDSRFIELNVGDTVPANATLLASYIDEIQAMSEKKYSYTMNTNGNKASDKYVFYLTASSSTLENSIHTEKRIVEVLDRSISGIAFEDTNNNQVFDNEDKLINNLKVELLNMGYIKIAETTTDEAGKYSFHGLSSGRYFVKFESKAGYELIAKGITDNSSKVNNNYRSDSILHTDDPTESNMEIPHINLGVYRKKTKLIVHHYLKGTNTKLGEDEEKDVYYSDEYTTKQLNPIPDNYQLDSIDGDDATGIVSKDNITVTYYYDLKPATLKVSYVDEDGNNIDESKNILDTNKHWTETYSTEKYNFIGYEFIEQTGDAPTGTISKDTIEVIYKYKLKSSILKVLYLNEEGNNIISPTEKIISWAESYTTEQKVLDNYDFVKQEGDAPNGVVDKDTITVKYIYRLKKGNVITHHYLYNGNTTTQSLAPDESKTYNYTEEYTTKESEKIPNNYEFHSKTNNYTGIVKSPSIEVTYYYQLKNSNLEATITKTATKEITSKTEPVNYVINYKVNIKEYIGDAVITLTQHLPYKIDAEKSNLENGRYNEEGNTITWIVNWNNINSYQETNLTATKEVKKNIEVVYQDIPTSDRIMTSNTTGLIELSNNSREVEAQASTNIKIKGKIIVKYVDIDTGELIEKEVNEEDFIGETANVGSIEKEGWILVEVPPKEEYEFAEEVQTVVYKYERIKYDVKTKVIGTGGTITGNEKVFYGEDSTKDNIIITADEGYVIDKIMIDGTQLKIKENSDKLVLDNFTNVKENHNIEVSFRTKIANPTTHNNIIKIIGMILIVAISVIVSKRKKIKLFQ